MAGYYACGAFIYIWSCGQLVMIFINYYGFPESQKQLKFSMTADLSKKRIFPTFPIMHISHQNEWIITFEWSCGHLVMIFIILEGFPEGQKNWVFDDCRPVEKANFSYFPNYAYFSSKWVNFYIWVALLSSGDDFHHFRRLSRKSKILGVFDDGGPVQMANFCSFSQFCIFLIQISEFLHFSCPMVIWWWFSSFQKDFQKVKKIEVFNDRGFVEKANFCFFSNFAYFSCKWVNFLNLSCPAAIWWWF